MTTEAPSVGDIDSSAGMHGVPASVVALGSLATVDYADRFVVSTEATAGPEQWARVMFGDVPSPAERLIWRGFLGIRLSRGRSTDTIAGWRIGGRGDDWIRLEAASWFLSANLLVEASDGTAALATLIRYDRWPARIIWTPLSAVHRWLSPRVLRKAAERLRSDR